MTAHADYIAQRKPDPWADERDETMLLLNACATPGREYHELYRRLRALYDEVFSLRATAAYDEQHHPGVKLMRDEAKRWERISMHFAEWASAFEEAITAGNVEHARELALQFRKSGSHETPHRSHSNDEPSHPRAR